MKNFKMANGGDGASQELIKGGYDMDNNPTNQRANSSGNLRASDKAIPAASLLGKKSSGSAMARKMASMKSVDGDEREESKGGLI